MNKIFLIMSTDSIPYALIDIKTSREKAEALCKAIGEYPDAPPNGTQLDYDNWEEKHPGITELRDEATNKFDHRNTTIFEYEVDTNG